MASGDDFKELITSTVLKDLLETVSKEPFEIPPVGRFRKNVFFMIRGWSCSCGKWGPRVRRWRLERARGGVRRVHNGAVFLVHVELSGEAKEIVSSRHVQEFRLAGAFLEQVSALKSYGLSNWRELLLDCFWWCWETTSTFTWAVRIVSWARFDLIKNCVVLFQPLRQEIMFFTWRFPKTGNSTTSSSCSARSVSWSTEM